MYAMKPSVSLKKVKVDTTTTKSLQSCPTLCDPIDGSPPGFAILGILQARTLEWVAISAKLTNVGVVLCCEFQTLEKHTDINRDLENTTMP